MRVQLNGYVVADDDVYFYRFFGFICFSPRDVRQALANNPKGEDLVLEINSPGGSVFPGFEMYSALRANRGQVHVVAEVQSLSASAASVLILGCDRVMLSPVAQVMIHLPSLCTEGNVNVHRTAIEMLESITTSILNAYELKVGGKLTRNDLDRLIRAETWMPAQEAVAAGLADGILYQEGEKPLVIPENITNAVGGGIRALAMSSGAMPSAESLRARYQNLVDEGKAPAVNDDGTPMAPTVPPAGAPDQKPGTLKDDWRNLARITLSKKRFFAN